MIQCLSEYRISNAPSEMPSGVFQKARYDSDHDELASTSATTVTTSNTTPLADSTCRNRASGPVTRSIEAVGKRTSSGWLCAIKFLTWSEARGRMKACLVIDRHILR